MPRYQYKKVVISSRRLGSRVVEMKRVGDAIAVLEAIGEGCLTITAERCKSWGEPFDPHSVIAIEYLLGKNEQAVWDLFDLSIDVAVARKYPFLGRLPDPASHGRWPGCPPDILKHLDCLSPESVFRLRHFAALMVLKIKLGEHVYAVSARERAAIDARLSEIEQQIVFRADLDGGLRDLLYLR